MYKDEDKRKEAGRARARRYRNAQEVTPNYRRAGYKPSSELEVNKGASPILEPNLKRGKEIKCFADLPPDVQKTIDMMSTVDGAIDRTVKANRTAIAVNYQHLYPGRYYSTGVA